MPHVNKDMISFFLTTNCNIACIYCYNSENRTKKKRYTLSYDFAKRGIDHYFSTSKSRHIRFYGPGEPTQEFALMKKIYQYANEVAPGAITSEIQTNGVFSTDCLNWLAENINYIWISFDGPPDIQNHNRPFGNGKGTSDIIEKNVDALLRLRSDRQGVVGARVTISDDTIYRQKEMVDYFKKIGINYIWTDAIFPDVSDCPFCDTGVKRDQFHFDMDAYATEFISAHQYAKDNDVFYGSFLMCNFDGTTNKFCRASIPAPHLTPDGYISACDLAVMGSQSNHMDPLIYGYYDDKEQKIVLDEDKVRTLQARTTESMPHCTTCEVSNHCAGYCMGEVLNETNSLFGAKPQTCQAIQKLARELGFKNQQYQFFHP